MKKMIWIFILLQFSCSQNLWEDASGADRDENEYNNAMNDLNQENYNGAILTITTKISTSGQTTPKVRELLASAYAGKCGLNFIDYTEALAAQSSGSAMFTMMAPFIQKAVDPASCRTALQTMELIGATAQRTLNQNMFTSVTGMVLLGTALRGYADLVPASGDGTADVDLCVGVTDAQIDDMIIGFGFFNKNFSAVSNTVIGSYASSNLANVGSMCNSVAGAPACEITDPANITPTMRSAFRDLVNTQEYGIGTFVSGGNSAVIPNACP